MCVPLQPRIATSSLPGDLLMPSPPPPRPLLLFLRMHELEEEAAAAPPLQLRQHRSLPPYALLSLLPLEPPCSSPGAAAAPPRASGAPLQRPPVAPVRAGPPNRAPGGSGASCKRSMALRVVLHLPRAAGAPESLSALEKGEERGAHPPRDAGSSSRCCPHPSCLFLQQPSRPSCPIPCSSLVSSLPSGSGSYSGGSLLPLLFLNRNVCKLADLLLCVPLPPSSCPPPWHLIFPLLPVPPFIRDARLRLGAEQQQRRALPPPGHPGGPRSLSRCSRGKSCTRPDVLAAHCCDA